MNMLKSQTSGWSSDPHRFDLSTSREKRKAQNKQTIFGREF
jgi:hypothetical protein